MKKVFYVFTFLVLFFAIISVPSFAATVPLDSVTTSVDKEKIAPGEEVTLTVNFGKEMGSYTVNAGYDNAIMLVNSAILAPVFWSWVVSPILKKLGVGYKDIDNTIG